MTPVHLAILGVTVLTILYSDHLGWQYFRGIKQTLDARIVWRLHYAVWAGLVGMIVTGLMMSWSALSYLITEPVFLLKMGFVAVLVINSLAITTLIGVATTTPYAALTQKQKAPFILNGALSTIGWVGAILAAVIFFG